MSSAKISNRGSSISYSSIRKLLPFAAKAEEEGVKVIRLNIGDPDLKTPKAFIDTLRNWDMNPIRYAHPQGEKVLLEALEGYYHSCGYDSLSKEDIIVTVGGSEALAMAMYAVSDDHDEILVPEPFFANYSIIAELQNVKLIPIPTDIKDGFRLPKREKIESLFTKRTKAILYSSPGNPTGTTYNKKEIEMLLDLCSTHGSYLISDEVYREFIFSDEDHVSLASYMDRYPKNIIMLDSFSKRYNLCGARLGMFVSKDKEVLDIVLRMANSRLSGGLIDQVMGSSLSKIKKTEHKKVSDELKGRRDVVYNELKKIKGVTTYLPEGAFYMMVKLPVKNAEEFCKFLLQSFRIDDTTVMLAPGKGFYLDPKKGINEIRIAYVVNKDELKKAINIIGEGLKAYKN